MTSDQVIELRKKWKQRVNRQPCLHLKQDVARGENGIVTATYHCLTCGKAVLRIYQVGEHNGHHVKTKLSEV